MNRKGLQFKGFVPSLVACLEDSDGGVRDTAKDCVVELFRYC
jgi:CLIP-associating protein 1/2